jgi:hypothetical protein
VTCGNSISGAAGESTKDSSEVPTRITLERTTRLRVISL